MTSCLVGKEGPLSCFRGQCLSAPPPNLRQESRLGEPPPAGPTAVLGGAQRPRLGSGPSEASVADASDDFASFLADQVQSFHKALLDRHQRELATLYGDGPRAEDSLASIHLDLGPPTQDIRQPTGSSIGCSDPIEEPSPKTPIVEAALELACHPSNLAKVDKMHTPRRKRSATISIRTQATKMLESPTSNSRTQASKLQPPKKIRSTSMVLGIHEGFIRQPTAYISTSWKKTISTPSRVSTEEKHVGDELRDGLSCMVSHPLRTRRLVYDIIALLLIWSELLLVPLELSELISTPTVQDAVMATVWSIDFLASFFRGFEQYGAVNLKFSDTALAYAKSWMLVDLGLVLLDWTLIILQLEAVASFARSSRIWRFGRALRLIKFVRFYRVPKLYSVVTSVLQSETAQTMLQIGSWIAGLLTLSHVIACLWYLDGISSSDGPSWVKTFVEFYVQQSQGEEPEKWYLYFTSLHWAVTQFTPASMEVTPKNLQERLYNIFTIIISMVLFPTFLSSISNSVTTFRKKNADYQQARANLSRYLLENRISMELGYRIQSIAYAQHANIRNTQRIEESDVSLLRLLPRSLKVRMHVEVYKPIIIMHPFLDVLTVSDERILKDICDEAMSQQVLKSGQELFAHGKKAEKMFFLLGGSMLYFQGSSPSLNAPEIVPAGALVCDQVLWMPWIHRGQMTAKPPCVLANLDAARFRSVITQHKTVSSWCCRFAKEYLAAVTEIEVECFNDIGCSAEMLRDMLDTVLPGVDE